MNFFQRSLGLLKEKGAEGLLFLGECLVWLEQRTQRGLQFYLIAGVSLVVGVMILAYYLTPWREAAGTYTVEEELATQKTSPELLPPRYLFFNDYYFFEEQLDLAADSQLILKPQPRSNVSTNALKEDFLKSDWYVNEKTLIDNELERLVR